MTKQVPPAVEIPAPPVVSHWGRIAWFCTAEGRLRHRLLLAHRRSRDSQRLMALEQCAALQLKNADRLRPSARSLLEQVLYYLAWRSLTNGAVDTAARLLTELDALAPSFIAVPPLRIALMEELLLRLDESAYLAHARILLTDARTVPDRYASEVLRILNQVYVRMGAARCRDLLAKVHPMIGGLKPVEAVIELCAAPAAIDAAMDVRPIDASLFNFSPLMMTDANVVNARLAECKGEWSAMLASCREAHRLVSTHRPAMYWLTRANLHNHSQGHDPGAHLTDAELPHEAAWERLKLLLALVRNPGVRTVTALLPVLRDEVGVLDSAETRLVAELIRAALEHSPAATETDNLGAIAEVCAAVQKKLGSSPWTQFHIAYKETALDRRYSVACARLEEDGVAGYRGAGYLLRVVRILRGAPSAHEKSHDDQSLQLIETAMHALLVSPHGPSLDFGSLRERFHAGEFQPLVARFPDFAPVIQVLRSALSVVAGDRADARTQLDSSELPKTAPGWTLWLQARLRLLTGDVLPSDKIPLDRDPATMIAVRAESDSALAAILSRESGLWTSWVSGRAALAQATQRKASAAAIKPLSDVLSLIDATCVMTAAWWRPLATYWLAVTYAHRNDQKAASLLQSLVGGMRTHEALGQLALMSLKNGDIAAAGHHLANASDEVPSVRYAKAVLLSRTGKAGEACELLVGSGAERSFVGSPYAAAAQSLIAAIHERAGHREQADRIHKEVLAAHPGHGASALRVTRQALETAYARLCAREAPDTSVEKSVARTLTNVVPRSKTARAQKIRCELLLALLNATTSDSLKHLARDVDAHITECTSRMWWHQLLAARFLSMGDPTGALAALDGYGDASAAAAVKRSRAILRACRELVVCSHGENGAEAARALEGHVHALESFGTGDPIVNSWRELACIAGSLLRGESVTPERWRMLSGIPMPHIAFLFDSDRDVRRDAAEALLPALQAKISPWNERTHRLLSALVAWAMQDDDSYLEHYAALEPMLGKLPVTGRDLWVPAALIRFSKGDWRGLSGAGLPDCVADLTDPLVCLIVELADARAVLDAVAKPGQAVVQKIESIRKNLVALVERLDAPQTRVKTASQAGTGLKDQKGHRCC